MRFLYPLGLWGLIGVPIIILIYVLKNKYNEQTVPSTYIWTLSEKFFKRRNPLSGLTGIISLILQLLAVVAISLAIARPIITVPNSAGEYCFVIDGSASMQMESGGTTRYERAKNEIEKLIKDAKLGSTFTLISSADDTMVVYERISDKDVALDMLERLEVTDESADFSAALASAQNYFDQNPSLSVYLFTDKTVEEHTNVEVINVASKKDKNSGIFNVSSTFLGGELTVNADIVSFDSDESLKVELYLGGDSKPAYVESFDVKAGERLPISVSCNAQSYDFFRIAIAGEDSYPADNEYVSYNLKNETSYSVLIVSETPFFLQAVIDVLTDARVDTVRPDEYTGGGNYGLCIFHSFTPEELPDSAVWLINASKNVNDSGFGARGVVTLDAPGEILKSNSTATTAQKLLNGIHGEDIYISEYIKYSGMYTKFTTLFSYDSNPLIFAGVNALGNREVVIGFDLHKADFSLSTDFAALLGNLLRYSCPDILEKSNYVCGEDAEINVTANMQNVKAIAPDGEEIYVDCSTDPALLPLDKVGSYTLKLLVSGVEQSYSIYSGAPDGESDPEQAGEGFILAGERQYEKSDGEFDPLLIILISLVLIFIADWMVYCYEKYQLR